MQIEDSDVEIFSRRPFDIGSRPTIQLIHHMTALSSGMVGRAIGCET
jgi:hypothetical protein